MRLKLLLLLIFTAQAYQNHSRAQTLYDVSFPNPNSHYINVDVHFIGLPADSFDVKMPVWTPGSYLVREYSKNVEGFQAYDPLNKQVKFRKIRKNVWRIYNDTTKAMSVSYRVYAYDLSIRTCYVDIDQAYINGAGLYMYTETLKEKPVLVNFKPWPEWHTISTGLNKFGMVKWSVTAENYDQLIDCPVAIGNHDLIAFDYKGISHLIAMVGKANYDKEKIKNDFYKIVDACTNVYGENPNKDYTFIIINNTTGGGGLEHGNSCSIMTARSTYENEKSYRSFLSLIAHEYFHLWSIKRIRPFELGPFDYDNEVYTNQLWFFEGITSYYDEYLLFRSGYYTEAEYRGVLLDNVSSSLNNPGDSIQSVAEASFDAWIKYYRRNENSNNSTVSYYTKGSLLGLILNIEIINSTNGAKSIDDVMKYLYDEHFKKLNRGLTDKELQNAFEKIAGKSLNTFFENYIYGTKRIPVEEYFNLAGMELMRTDGMIKPMGYLGATFTQSGSRLLVSAVERRSAAWEQGLYVNDEILGIDGKEPMQLNDYLAEKLPGDKVTFKIIRSGIQREFTIMLGEPTLATFQISDLKKVTPQQKAVKLKLLNSSN